jgi:hypothetical protein
MGTPTGAEQGGLFFPLRLPFYLFPSPCTYGIFRALRLVFVAIGAFLFARSRGVGPLGAFLTGGAVELSGGMIVATPFAACSPYYCLPWVLLGVSQLAARRYRIGIVTEALALAMTFLGGHPTLTLVICLGLVAAFVGHVWEQRSDAQHVAAMTGCVAFAAALGGALAAPSLIPFAELLNHGHSYKTTEMLTQLSNDSLTFVRSGFWIGAFAPAYVETLRDQALGYPYTAHTTFGLLVLVLALGTHTLRRYDLPSLLVFLLGLDLCLAAPGFRSLGLLPYLRYVLPRYGWPLLSVPIALWAGRGLDDLARGLPSRTRKKLWVVSARPWLGPLLLLSGGVFATVALSLATLPMLEAAQTKFRPLLLAAVAQPSGRLALLGPPLTALALLALVVLLWRRRPDAARALLALGALVELGVYARQHLDAPRGYAFDREVPEEAQALATAAHRAHARMTTAGIVGFPNVPLLAEIPDARVLGALIVDRYWRYLNAGGPTSAWNIYNFVTIHSPLVDLAAVRYVVVAHNDSAPLTLDADPEMRLWRTGRAVDIYENFGAVPRARLVHRTAVAESMEEAFERLAQASTRAVHARDAALVDFALLEPSANGARPEALTTDDTSDGDVAFVRDQPDVVTLRVRTSARAYVVVADTYYPGWVATVDGAPAPIFPADGMFRAVAVAAGDHNVELRYQPTSFRLGTAFALCALLTLGMILGAGSRTTSEWRLARGAAA